MSMNHTAKAVSEPQSDGPSDGLQFDQLYLLIVLNSVNFGPFNIVVTTLSQLHETLLRSSIEGSRALFDDEAMNLRILSCI